MALRAVRVKSLTIATSNPGNAIHRQSFFAPLAEYAALLAAAGLKVKATEEHDGALIDFVNQIRTRLLATEVMLGLNKVALPGLDIAIVKDFTRTALNAIRAGKIGYAILTAARG